MDMLKAIPMSPVLRPVTMERIAVQALMLAKAFLAEFVKMEAAMDLWHVCMQTSHGW